MIIDVNAPNFDSKVKALMEKRIAREQEEKSNRYGKRKAKGEQEEKRVLRKSLKILSKPAFLNSQICKAGIATMMGRDPKSCVLNEFKIALFIYLIHVKMMEKIGLIAAKIEGDKVIWSSDTGRWMTNHG